MTTDDGGSGGESRGELQLAGRGHVSKRGVPTTTTANEVGAHDVGGSEQR